jgi:hypothetical protein
MRAWHFVGAELRDGRPVPADGETLVHDGPLVMCESGLHASRRLIDALQYAPGSTVCRVELGGEIIQGDDKLVARERTILWRVDADTILRDFARRCALDVIHLWAAPAVVREYLTTGDESLRAAAWDEAWDAARAAARAAARTAARDAARAEAWDAARAAAWAAARTAARTAARDAAWAEARDAARAAARAAARVRQNQRLTAMVSAARRGPS